MKNKLSNKYSVFLIVKYLEKISLYILGLTLIFSLVSFSDTNYQSHTEMIKTELVVTEKASKKRYSIGFNKANKIVFASFFFDPKFSFQRFKSAQDLKNYSIFKTYRTKVSSVITEQFQLKLYSSFNQKLLYENFLV